MSYDPSGLRPPRQERWPSATPPEGWPTYRGGDAYRGGDGYRGGAQADGWYGTNRQSDGSWQQADYQPAVGGSGDRGYQSPTATSTFAPARHGYGGYRTGGRPGSSRIGGANGYAWDGFDEAASGYRTADYGYGGAADGYAGNENGYLGTVDGYHGSADGYGRMTDGFDGATDGYGWAENGYGWAEDGYGQAADGYPGDAGGYASQPDEYDWEPAGYGSADHGDAAGPDAYPSQIGYLGQESYIEYNEPGSGDPRLVAPDAGVYPDSWQAEQDSRRETGRRGRTVGAVTVVLGTAVAIGVSTLAAGLFRARTSAAAAMGSVFVDRTPAVLRNALAHRFGPHGQTVLLLGMYAAIAFIALVIGVLARRAAALGVAGIAAFTLFAAFVVVTRPASHVDDVMPVIVGGIAGVAALLWLVRASAPPQRSGPLRHARDGARRRTR
jgi:hypothetical protein